MSEIPYTDEQIEELHGEADDSSEVFLVGHRVIIFDRYRLASRDVTGVVAEVSTRNDGVQVNLDKEYQFLLGGTAEEPFWVCPQQLRLLEGQPRAKKPANHLTFGDVLAGLEERKRYQRAGWNGSDMFISLQTPSPESMMTLPYIWMYTAQGEHVPWLASQSDMLAKDWRLYAV